MPDPQELPPLPPLPELSFLGDDVSYGYDRFDMRDYALEAQRQAFEAGKRSAAPAGEALLPRGVQLSQEEGAALKRALWKVVKVIPDRAAQPTGEVEKLATQHGWDGKQSLAEWLDTELRDRQRYVELLDEALNAGLDEAAAKPTWEAGKDAARWQPIETAPRDGTHIIAYRPTSPPHIECMHWVDYEEGDGGAWYWSYDGDSPASSPPTHWMPLPAAPAMTKEAKNG